MKGWKRELTRGQEAILARLRDERDVIADLEKRLRPVRTRRTLLVVKAVRAGLPTRLTGEAAGISSSAVSQIVQRWDRKHGD